MMVVHNMPFGVPQNNWRKKSLKERIRKQKVDKKNNRNRKRIGETKVLRKTEEKKKRNKIKIRKKKR